MKKTIKLFLALFIFVAVSCDKEEMTQEPIIPETLSDVGEIILGEKINDPYRLENMQLAYNSLISNVSGLKSSGDQVLEPTHNYIRFLPTTPDQLDLIRNDTNLNLFCHPLDYEILEGGSYYEDPDLPDGAIASFYGSVPIVQALPNVDYEIIYECYIPEVEDEMLKNAGMISFEQIEDESYRLTGAVSEEELNEPHLKGSKWKYPKGTFRIANHVTNQWIGVSRVRVKMWRTTKTGWAWTNEDGYYKSSRSFRYDPHYKIKFESKDGFKIWGNWAFTNEATYNLGKHSKSGLSRDISRNSGAWKWCAVNNAVQRYRFHTSNYGITLPPSDLRIWVLEKNDGTISGAAPMTKRCYGNYGFHTTSHFNTFLNYMTGVNILTTYLGNLATVVMPDIFINVNSNNVEIDNVYRTVFHELAHASHWQKVGNSYWIKYINYILTYGSRDEPYGRGTGLNAEFCGVGEIWGNYFGSLLVWKEFNYRNIYPQNISWDDIPGIDPDIGNLRELLDEDEDWYNPGFMRRVHSINDIYTIELYECLVYNTNTFDKLITALKTKTHSNNHATIDQHFINTDNDWL